jgi:hypothetical protein
VSKIDKFLNSWVSKKLFVLVVATALALSSKVTGSEWVNVAMVYIGSQSAIDFMKQLRNSAK